MKKLFITAAMLLVASAGIAKYKPASARIISPECKGDQYENDSLVIGVSAFDDVFLGVYIENKLKDRIYVEWENFRWDGGAIAFPNDSRLFMDRPKQDEAIMSGEHSRKSVIRKSRVGSSMVYKWYNMKDLKKRGTQREFLIIPIRFSSGETKDYKIVFDIFPEPSEK